MTEIRALVITRKAADLPIDHITNTLYFDTDSPFTWEPEWLGGLNEAQLAKDIRDVFRARSYHGTSYGVEVKLYDMQDAEPRVPKGMANWAAATGAGTGAIGPREVALCLSFRGSQNTKRTRGRIYLGPFPNTALTERPGPSMRSDLVTLATAIGNVGGVDIDWCVRSSFGNAMHPVKHAWIDDEWDTVRSRGLKPTTRNTATLDE